MTHSVLRRLALATLFVAGVFMVTGCDPNANQIGFLDVVNTALLGVTAAGAIAILRNV